MENPTPDYSHIQDLNNELLSTLQILKNAFETSQEVTGLQKGLTDKALTLSEEIKTNL